MKSIVFFLLALMAVGCTTVDPPWPIKEFPANLIIADTEFGDEHIEEIDKAAKDSWSVAVGQDLFKPVINVSPERKCGNIYVTFADLPKSAGHTEIRKNCYFTVEISSRFKDDFWFFHFIVVHELGHTLGLPESNDKHSVMHWFAPTEFEQTITKTDVEHVKEFNQSRLKQNVEE